MSEEMKETSEGQSEKKSCNRCSRCCSYFCVEIDEPESRDEFDDLAWIIAHEGVAIHICDGDWQLIVYNRCKYLLPEGGCGIYDTRPRICREHTPGDCEFDQEHEHDYDDIEHVFRTMDDLWNYRKEQIRINRSEGAKRAAKKRKRNKKKLKMARKNANPLPPCNEGDSPIGSGPSVHKFQN